LRLPALRFVVAFKFRVVALIYVALPLLTRLLRVAVMIVRLIVVCCCSAVCCRYVAFRCYVAVVVVGARCSALLVALLFFVARSAVAYVTCVAFIRVVCYVVFVALLFALIRCVYRCLITLPSLNAGAVSLFCSVTLPLFLLGVVPVAFLPLGTVTPLLLPLVIVVTFVIVAAFVVLFTLPAVVVVVVTRLNVCSRCRFLLPLRCCC